MTSGTKIFLAVFALFVGILVVYYGVLMPDGSASPAVAKAAHDAAAPKSEDAGEHHVNPSQMPDAADDSAQAASDIQPTIEPAVVIDQTPINRSGNATDVQSTPPGALPLTHPNRIAMGARTPQRPTSPPATPGASGTSRPQANPVAPVQIEPKPAAPAPAAPPSQEATEYIVKSGDSMWTIAESWYGDRSKWTLIAKANPLADPARMQIGDKLKLPPKDAAVEKPAPPKTPETPKNPPSPDDLIYIVKPGDTLARIARDLYGEFYIWETIYEMNKDVIGDDPAALSLDMKLKLPKPPTKKSG